jgi:CheY-like chemotaxis protein
MRRADSAVPTVLLADDDADDRELAREAMAQASVAGELRCVGDGEELLEYLHRRGRYVADASAPTPGVVLLDLNMPLKGGREVLAEMQADPVLRRIPVVVLTTSSSEEDIAAAYDLGASSYVTKPVSFGGLVDVMRDFSRWWLQRVELPAPAST